MVHAVYTYIVVRGYIMCTHTHTHTHIHCCHNMFGGNAIRTPTLDAHTHNISTHAHKCTLYKRTPNAHTLDQQYLATSSRDRLIHVFTCGSTYQHMQTLDEHSASITSIKFTGEGHMFVCTCTCMCVMCDVWCVLCGVCHVAKSMPDTI